MDLFGNENPPAPHPDAEILVPFPEGFCSDDEEVDEPDLVAYFQEQLGGPFRQALDLDLHGDREIVDDVNVTNVEADAGSVMVEYSVEFSAYLGCRDQNYADEDDRSADGVGRGRYWVFTRHISPEKLAPNEEL